MYLLPLLLIGQNVQNSIHPSAPYRYIKPLNPNFKADYWAAADSISEPSSLDYLVKDSNIIVIGKFEGIIEHRHRPDNADWMYQSTIYAFSVEAYLKGEGASLIKILQPGGPLPWKDYNTNKIGQGYRIPSNPFPLVGGRYILFLNDPSITNALMRRDGYIKVDFHGTKSFAQYADEFGFIHATCSKVLLKDGMAFPGQVIEDPKATLVFKSGPMTGELQITGVSEQQAVINIKKSILMTSPEGIKSKYKFNDK